MNKLIDLENTKLIDLTHSLSSDIPQWDLGCGFYSHVRIDYSDSKDDAKFRVHKLQMNAGIGTHIDAPRHCFQNGASIADIPLENLITSCVVIDISAKAHANYTVSLQDIAEFESKHDKIPKNTFVIIHTGWGKYWSTPDKYRNNLIFPSVSKEVAEILLMRHITGIGIDTLSPDRANEKFPVHQTILGAGKYIIENIANAHKLPTTGSFIIGMPLKIKEGSEAPMRLIGVIPQQKI